ncbi:MAG: chemotaxis protein CheA [Cytophagales bacterium]|nr:chemotaxis protein CheA [Cytophagales bacterium]
MKSKEEEYKALFLADALQNFEELNKHFIVLEKKHSDKQAVNSIFRIVHTLKGNAMGMGYEAIANLTHVMEDLMGEIKENRIELDSDLFASLFRAADKLGELIKALETGGKVSYLGIRTKLEVLLKNRKEDQAPEAEETPEVEPETAPEPTTPVVQEEEAVEEADTDEITFADVIQIPVRKMDELMTLVGQLIIEKDRLIAENRSLDRRSQFEGLQRISSNLQYAVMNARMVQMGFLFNKFHRIVRDAAVIEGKDVSLELKGTHIEIDRNVLKAMGDSLIHLVRNAVSHGVEMPKQRKELGKPKTGTITLDASYEKDYVQITIIDDGQGIDEAAIRKKLVEKKLMNEQTANALSEDDVIRQIFQPGFSNAAKVTEISGRGVGMDVVKKAVESVGGQVIIDTEINKGTTIKLLLPSSLALKGALLFELSEQTYAIALSYTEAVLSLKKGDIHKLGNTLMTKYQEETIPILFLKDLIGLTKLSDVTDGGVLHHSFKETADDQQFDMIVVSFAGKLTGIVVDRLLYQKEIIEKPLAKPLDKTKLLSGTTILGNGQVCPVIDIAAMTEILFKSSINQ